MVYGQTEGVFSKIVLGFWNLVYNFWGVGRDVWRWLCRQVHPNIFCWCWWGAKRNVWPGQTQDPYCRQLRCMLNCWQNLPDKIYDDNCHNTHSFGDNKRERIVCVIYLIKKANLTSSFWSENAFNTQPIFFRFHVSHRRNTIKDQLKNVS